MNNILRKHLGDEFEESVKKKKFPNWTDPMLAKLHHNSFSDEEWIYERKLDGMRVLVFKRKSEVHILSRNKKDQNHVFPELHEELKKQKEDYFIVDGEIVTFENDITSFSRLQNRIHVNHPADDLIRKHAVYLYLFDILYLDQYDLSGLPLRQRKAILKDALNFDSRIRYTQHRNEKGEEYIKEACKSGWEGLIAKNANSKYVHSRSSKWLKLKCVNRQEMVIGGFTDPQGERLKFGSILIGYYDNGDLKYAGKVGTGFDDQLLKDLGSRMEEMETDKSPFQQQVKEKNVHWIKPKLVTEIGFTEWTGSGKLRHPRFIGLRKDKKPKEVVKEN